uniref:Aminoacyl-transfer RNA synthetases class-II family profile domain-containing protein n=1 Tax=Meloidogyne incognita TaxID=6306 RepID=A0A914LBN6_MELIC
MFFRKACQLQIQLIRKCSGLSSSVRINDLLNESEPKQDVIIQGWVRHVQRYGKILFLKLNDGNCPHQLQAVVPRTICHTIHVGSALRLRGQWVPSIGTQQQMEFLAEQCIFINEPSELVVDTKDKDALRLIPHLRPKKLEFASILRMRSHLNSLIHKFFNDRHFIHIDTPLFSQNDCEGAGEAFSATCSEENFFGDTKSFLPVSAQLHLEAMSSSLGNVYTLSPVFRANPSETRQHLAEFKMLEVECAFSDSLEHICNIVEEFIRFLVSKTEAIFQLEDFEKSSPFCQQSSNDEEKSASSQTIAECLDKNNTLFPRISFTEATKLLRRQPNESKRQLSKRDEFDLVDIFGGPLFVTHFPSEQKPFYMRRTDDGKFTESFDLIAPFVGELAGGSIREWDEELLTSRLPKENKEKLEWYIELRRYGYPRSGGFGIGVDRLMQSLFGIKNIKDTIPFPRWSKQTIKC